MRAGLLLMAAALGACSYIAQPPRVRGNKVDVEQLGDLVPGTSTRADVSSLLGSPTAKGSFDDNSWFYITETTQPRVGRVQGINSQQVIAVTFDDRGVLKGWRRYDKGDAQDVAVVARATPSPGSESSILQQLLGNVGKFNAGPSAGGGGSGLSVGK